MRLLLRGMMRPSDWVLSPLAAVFTRGMVMSDENAEIELRNFTNKLLGMSCDHSLEEMKNEFDNFYKKYTELYPDYSIYALRRYADVRCMLFVESMSDMEKEKLYDEYELCGFDNIGSEISTIYRIYKFSEGANLRDKLERKLIDIISGRLDDESISVELSWMPDIAEKARGVLKKGC